MSLGATDALNSMSNNQPPARRPARLGCCHGKAAARSLHSSMTGNVPRGSVTDVEQQKKKKTKTKTSVKICNTSSFYVWPLVLTLSILQVTQNLIPAPQVLAANAAQAPHSMYQANHDKREIIVLNSTNFNQELIQHNHPFPHIKLIEYYLAYCGICLKFKQTYVQFSKEIRPWRNVVRPSAIDLGVSSNSPIAHSWSIDMIPTLRIHPPLSPQVAARLSSKLAAWSQKSSQSDIQKLMYEAYSEAGPMIGSLRVVKYMNDSKRDADSSGDKSAILKADLLSYIERFVAQYPAELPETWPNLRPVTERTLLELRRYHPRQELFLIIEAGGGISESDQASTQPVSLGLRVMMELSSSASWKAVRYVRASDNRALVEDVIALKKRESSELSDEGQSGNNNGQSSDLKLLVKLLDNKRPDPDDANNMALIHIDDSHSPFSHTTKTPTTKFPSITVVTSSDLAYMQQNYDSLNSATPNLYKNDRLRRSIKSARDGSQRARRALAHEQGEDKPMNIQRKLELVAQFINQTYIEVEEDREFLKALSSFDESPTSPDLRREAIEKFQVTRQQNKNVLNANIKKSEQLEQHSRKKIAAHNSSTNTTTAITQLFNHFSQPSSANPYLSQGSDYCGHLDDYEDKLKAIRYIFFQEVPRKSLVDKSAVEKLERLNTLVNLAAVIKVYFPLPDSASVQFVDAIHAFLTKQQAAISTSLINQQQDRPSGHSGNSNNFDFRALKQVIKGLEADGKRLPEIKDWKHCKASGYPCALWRLFHTLTAFEYKKLSQISQQYSTSLASSKQRQQDPSRSVVPTPTTATNEQADEDRARPVQTQASAYQETSKLSSVAALESSSTGNNVIPAPVERVVSPPVTTTSFSLTIASPNSVFTDNQNIYDRKRLAEAELPEPVLLVMRDYITNFFSCEECARNFREEAIGLSFDKIRRQEAPEFSMLWLWETHNRVSKRLSVNPDTNPPEHPKKWFPAYEQCPKCYNKPPSYLRDTSVDLAAIFHESIDWNQEETLAYLIREYTRQPMDTETNIFGYHVPYGFNFILVIGSISTLLIVLLRCASCYIERQRRHKATLLNGNGAHYSVELQAH